MKTLIVILALVRQFLTNIIDSEDYTCKTQLLQFYGLGGVSNPLHYASLRQQMNNDFCPGIEYSCCTREDFQLTIEMWNKKSDNVKRYLTKLFKVIQKTTILQGSLVNLAGTLRNKNATNCREVDFTFFNSPVKYDEVYFYIQNALEAFAFLQKGFYCTICDAKQHQYLGIDIGITRRVAVIDQKFCNDIIFFFREFIMFKVYFIDPLVKNSSYLFNCYEDTDKYNFNFHYNTTYYNMETCVEKGENCEYLCKEFKFGSTSELFIGSLKGYYDYFVTLQRIVQDFDENVHADLDDEFYIDQKEYPEEFFADPLVVNESQSLYLLKDFNMTNWEINIAPKGINMFDIAAHSNYFLTDANTRKVMMKNYGITGPDDTGPSTNKLEQSLDNEMGFKFEKSPAVAKYKEEADWEHRHEKEKLEQNPNTPSKTEMGALESERDRLEQAFSSRMRSEEGLESEVERSRVDFGKAEEIPQDYEGEEGRKEATIVRVMIGAVMMLLWVS